MANDKKEMKKVLKRMQKRNAKQYSKLCRSECVLSDVTDAGDCSIVEPPKVDLDYLSKVLGGLNEYQTKFFEANKDILRLSSVTNLPRVGSPMAYREAEMYYASFGISVIVKMHNLE